MLSVNDARWNIVDTMPIADAERSTHGPVTAPFHTTSVESVPETAITSSRWPRYVNGVPPLPAALTTTIPARVAAVTAASSPLWLIDVHEQLTTAQPMRVA